MTSARALSSGFAAALADPAITKLVLVELGFAGGTEYACTTDFPVTYAGITWQPTYGLLQIGGTAEQAGSYDGVEITISGVTGSNIALALGERVQGRPLTLRLALLVAGTLVADDNVWRGTMDQLRLRRSDDGTQQVVITAEHQMATWDRPRPSRYTDAEQRALHPGDTACRHVKDAETTVPWPDASFFKQ